MEQCVLSPNDYGFENQYFFYEKNKSIVVGNTTINTSRLRCGYIENSFVNLSCRREDAGVAFLEYSLDKNIHKIVTNLSYWGSKEYFTPIAIIEMHVWDNANSTWELFYDLKDAISKDRTSQTQLKLLFPENTQKFRFYVSDIAAGTYNRGRLSIGETELICY